MVGVWNPANWPPGSGGGGGAVDSVFGRTGVVVAKPGDYPFKSVWDFWADQGMVDTIASNWPTSATAPAAPSAVANSRGERELVKDAVTGFGMYFDVPPGATKCKIRVLSRGTGTAGPWVAILRASGDPDNAAPTAFAAEEPMTAFVMPADTDGQYDEQEKTLAEIGGITAGSRGVMQLTRDQAGQAGDTVDTSVFARHVQLIFS